MTRTYGSLFSGFEGAGIGAKAAGFTHAWGNEYDTRIAEVAAANGFSLRVMNVLDADPHTFVRVDWLHASPPCVRASTANQSAKWNDEGTKETKLDVDMALKVAEFIRVLRPRYVTIENVSGYRKFKRCMRAINSTLDESGYWSQSEILNAADFGVPQSRRRWIMRAELGAMPNPLPPPVPWVGWYEAIEDLIPTLPESRFADWQLARLPDDLQESVMIGAGGYDGSVVMSSIGDPANTTTSNSNMGQLRAFIIDGQSSRNYDGGGVTIRQGDRPMFTVTSVAGSRPAHMPRALIVDGQNANTAQVLNEGEPAMTVVANNHGTPRASVAGRVVQMTPRALARFQSFPDWYQLPPSNALAVKGIGNAVPPLMMQRIGEAW